MNPRTPLGDGEKPRPNRPSKYRTAIYVLIFLTALAGAMAYVALVPARNGPDCCKDAGP